MTQQLRITALEEKKKKKKEVSNIWSHFVLSVQYSSLASQWLINETQED